MFTTAAHETESLAMAVTTQGNTDILLSNVQLVSDIQQPVIWPSDGILRQVSLLQKYCVYVCVVMCLYIFKMHWVVILLANFLLKICIEILLKFNSGRYVHFHWWCC